MHRIAFAALSIALVSVAACSTPSSATSNEAAVAAPVRGKPGAPVTVDAVLGRGAARVTVRFDAAARDARVQVHGVDGLVVTSTPTPVDVGALARGATQTFDVTFTPGAGRSHLVVSVSGDFGGATQSRVASFTVGGPSARLRADVTTTDGTGERVRLMPLD